MIKRDPKTDEYLGMQCDGPECEVMSPPTAEIMAGHGLNNMGWHCSGGTHLCPLHAPEKAPEVPKVPKVPVERRDTRHLP